MRKPSDDEGLHMVRDNKPRPRLFQEDISEADLRNVRFPAAGRWSFKRIATAIGIVLVLALLAAGVAYWMERHRYPVVVAIDPPKKNAAEGSLTEKIAPLVPIKPDMLEVTSISLGEPRLAIINGRELTEGESIAVKTTLGRASLRVTSIQDGLVRFQHGGQTIDVRLQAAQRTPH